MTVEHLLGKRLKQLRKRHKLTQERVAEKAGIDPKYYQSLEGKRPPSATLRTLDKLSKAFSMPIWKLVKFK